MTIATAPLSTEISRFHLQESLAGGGTRTKAAGRSPAGAPRTGRGPMAPRFWDQQTRPRRTRSIVSGIPARAGVGSTPRARRAAHCRLREGRSLGAIPAGAGNSTRAPSDSTC